MIENASPLPRRGEGQGEGAVERWSRALAIIIAMLPVVAHAHAVGLSQGEYKATSDGLEAQLTFTKTEVEAAPKLAERIEAPGCTLEDSTWSTAERDGL